jgi:hypothetical protein
MKEFDPQDDNCGSAEFSRRQVAAKPHSHGPEAVLTGPQL